MPNTQLKLLWVLTIAALLVMLIYLANHLVALMHIDDEQIPGCQLKSGSCHIRLDNSNTLTLSVSPWPVVALQPVRFQVTSEQLNLDSAQLSLTGRSMYMGIHKYALSPAGDDTLAVNGTISVCTEKVMPWRGRLELKAAERTEHIWFDFNVHQM